MTAKIAPGTWMLIKNKVGYRKYAKVGIVGSVKHCKRFFFFIFYYYFFLGYPPTDWWCGLWSLHVDGIVLFITK